ncbi:MAG: SurA N-terminal domain-containing protein, partial [Luteimonas sp.]
MLQKLRDKTSGWIATVILGLLVVPFAFFGMEQYLFQRSDTFVAKIEAPPKWWQSAPVFWPVTMLWQRNEIDADEFRTAFEQARQQQRQQQGEQFDARAFESIDSKRKVLDGLIDQRVLQMTAGRAGIAIGDAQVREAIEGIPAFQVDGKFDPQRYQLALASQVPARSPRQFEQLVREGLQQSLIPTQVAQSALVTPSELQRLLKLLGEKRDIGFVTMPAPVADTAPVSAAKIQHWYDSHVADYRAPETVTLEYLDIDGNTLPAPAAADDAALRERYEQEKTRFIEPEQRLVSHL